MNEKSSLYLLDVLTWFKNTHFRKYKGRAVSRGDNVKEHEDYQAVFTTQGTSVSQMTTETFLDTIGRLPGMSGNVDDVLSGNTYVLMSDASRLLNLFEKECPQIWYVFYLEEDQDPATASKTSLCHCIPIYTTIRSQVLWERKVQEVFEEQGSENVPFCEVLIYVPGKNNYFFFFNDDNLKMTEKNEKIVTQCGNASIWEVTWKFFSVSSCSL